MSKLSIAASLVESDNRPKYFFPHQPLQLMQGVVPEGAKSPILAMDNSAEYYAMLNNDYVGAGFPGYPYLAQLATRAEFRAMSNALSGEMTRKWIKFTSTSNVGDKLQKIEAEFKKLKVKDVIKKAVQHDANFGRAQIYLDIRGADREKPLIIDPRSIGKGDFIGLRNVEAIWTTPSAYNAVTPTAADFYKPSEWYILGVKTNAQRLLTITSNELPDILKPAYNFSGISLYQLAEIYVDNWLRTRTAVSDLVNNFSLTAIATDMSQVLQGTDTGQGLMDRIRLFSAYKSNKGVLAIDKEREELVQLNVPLGGLHELQGQAQEQMCSVSRMPAIVLTGISPGGLNASSDSEIRVFYDWILSQQEAFYRQPLEIILQLVQLSLFGEIDDSIHFEFVPLYQMSDKEKSEIRLNNSQTASNYVAVGAVGAEEVRRNLAEDKESGYNIETDTE